MASKYLAVFENPAGADVLEHLKKMLGVEDTLEPEEWVSLNGPVGEVVTPIPLDPLAMAKRLGQKSVYWKIIAIIRSAKEEKSNES
jgi:hypothetical protein